MIRHAYELYGDRRTILHDICPPNLAAFAHYSVIAKKSNQNQVGSFVHASDLEDKCHADVRENPVLCPPNLVVNSRYTIFALTEYAT